MLKQAALAIGSMLAAVGYASAETPEQRQACTDSAFEFCQQAMPDRERVFACLMQNKDVIAPLCREALAPYMPPEPAPQEASKTKVKTSAKTKTKPTTKTKANAKTKSKTGAKAKSKKIAGPLNLNPKAR